MANYGQLLDDYDPSKEGVYALFTRYFNNPTMTKIKDATTYSVYMAKVHALLGIEFKYIIAIIFRDKAQPGSKENLSNLKWVTIQTRTLPDEHDLPMYSYLPRRLPELDKRIKIVSQNEQEYVYAVQDLPLMVTLLPKTKGLDYTTSGTVVTALETYNTIVSWK